MNSKPAVWLQLQRYWYPAYEPSHANNDIVSTLVRGCPATTTGLIVMGETFALGKATEAVAVVVRRLAETA